MLTTHTTAAPTFSNASPRARVLLVDDDALARHRAARSLAHHGYEVVSASTVSTALEQIRRGRIDAVVAQTCLTDGTGFDVVHAVRGRRAHVPVVLVGSDPGLPSTLATPTGAVRYRHAGLGPDALASAVAETWSRPAACAA